MIQEKVGISVFEKRYRPTTFQSVDAMKGLIFLTPYSVYPWYPCTHRSAAIYIQSFVSSCAVFSFVPRIWRIFVQGNLSNKRGRTCLIYSFNVRHRREFSQFSAVVAVAEQCSTCVSTSLLVWSSHFVCISNVVCDDVRSDAVLVGLFSTLSSRWRSRIDAPMSNAHNVRVWSGS